MPFPSIAAAQTAEQPIVQCVLFYSPTCPHCHLVITELLIPMQEQYGEQLQILGVDISNVVGNGLYGQAIQQFNIPQQRQGVPTLILGETVLVGSDEIPEQFPTLFEAGLAAGAIGWPDIPGLTLAVPDLPPRAGPAAGASAGDPPAEAPTVNDAPQNPDTDLAAAATVAQGPDDAAGAAVAAVPPADPVGFSLAGLTLFGMVGALVYTGRLFRQSPALYFGRTAAIRNLPPAIPILASAGLGVALYLSYVEITQVQAICGPVGECNIVQFSPYARVLGVPVAVLGALSYLATIILWAGQKTWQAPLSHQARLGLTGLTVFGTLFSIYLTMLELFVIKAICVWCLSSAVITAALMVLVVRNQRGDSTSRHQPDIQLEKG